MKFKFLSLLFCFFCLNACKNNEAGKNTVTSEIKSPTSNASDSLGITESLHGFYTWYDANEEKLAKIDFIEDDKKGGSVLNEKKLQKYLAEVKKSGFVSDELIADETKFYHACAKIWVKEQPFEVHTGLESDRFLCAQDYIAPYNTGIVKSIINGDRAHATLTLKDGMNSSNDFNYEMKKENGKWLIAKLDCDSGVKY